MMSAFASALNDAYTYAVIEEGTGTKSARVCHALYEVNKISDTVTS